MFTIYNICTIYTIYTSHNKWTRLIYWISTITSCALDLALELHPSENCAPGPRHTGGRTKTNLRTPSDCVVDFRKPERKNFEILTRSCQIHPLSRNIMPTASRYIVRTSGFRVHNGRNCCPPPPQPRDGMRMRIRSRRLFSDARDTHIFDGARHRRCRQHGAGARASA